MRLEYVIDADIKPLLDMENAAARMSSKVEGSFTKLDKAVNDYVLSLTKSGYKISENGRVMNAYGQVIEGATSKLARLKQAQEQYNPMLTRTSQAVGKATNDMRSMNGVIGNLGFQLQDVAVQAQMGTNAFVILGQQGSQIAGAFGPGGAVIGAFIAIGAAILNVATSLDESSEAFERFQESVSNMSDEDLAKLTGTSQAQALDEFTTKLKEQEKQYESGEQKLSDLIAQYAEYDRQLEAIDRTTERGMAQYAATQRAQEDLTKEINTQEKALGQLATEAQKTSVSVSILSGETKVLTEEQKQANEAIASTITNLQTQAAVIGMTAKGAALYRLELMGATEEQLKAAGVALDAIETERKREISIRNSTRAVKDRAKAERESRMASLNAVKNFGASLESDDSFFTGISATGGQTPKVTQLRNERELILELQELEYGDAQAHAARLMQIDDELAKHKAQAMSQMLGLSANGFEAMADLVGTFAGEQSGAFKALFAVSKSFALAQAALNMQQAISQALSLGFPQNVPMMAQAAAAGSQIASTIGSISYGGGRLYGGATSANSMYRVNENGRPEMFTTKGGQQYMMSGQAGHVTPASDLGGNTINLNVTQNLSITGNMTQEQKIEMYNISKSAFAEGLQQQMRQGGVLAGR